MTMDDPLSAAFLVFIISFHDQLWLRRVVFCTLVCRLGQATRWNVVSRCLVLEVAKRRNDVDFFGITIAYP